jgi:uncharacterized protein YidB (DUF937 family)
MQISKDQLMELIRSHGDDQKTAQAEQELPPEIDTDRDQNLLDKFGIDPQELLSRFKEDIPGL